MFFFVFSGSSFGSKYIFLCGFIWILETFPETKIMFLGVCSDLLFFIYGRKSNGLLDSIQSWRNFKSEFLGYHKYNLFNRKQFLQYGDVRSTIYIYIYQPLGYPKVQTWDLCFFCSLQTIYWRYITQKISLVLLKHGTMKIIELKFFKCKVMLFYKKYYLIRFNYSLGNVTLDRCETFQDLG